MKHAIKFGGPNDMGKHILATAHIDNYPVERQGIILTAQVLCSHVAEWTEKYMYIKELALQQKLRNLRKNPHARS